MDVSLIRKLWATIEAMPDQRISTLDDSSVLAWLMDLLQSDPTFDTRQSSVVSHYIQSRMPLIRDMAQSA